jgi:Flp pilus assembly protein TadG
MAEMAIVLPVFVVMLFAVIEFGRAFNYWIDQTHLANEAARWVVVNKDLSALSISGCTAPPTTAGALTACLRSQADSGELKDASTGMTAQVTFPATTCNVGDPTTVTVTYTKNWLPFLKLAPTTITGSATMRIEAKPTNYSGCT